MDRKIEKRKIASLKAHPRQGLLFAELGVPQIRELAQHIGANGLLNPIEVTPDGTILCGHQRVQAARLLGWEEIDVWVRDDLASAGDWACEARVIEDNLVRRQLSGLEKARCLKRLRELELSRPTGEGRKDLCGDLRDVIGAKLGMNGRNADRYLTVLKTPNEVQEAFGRGEISLVKAGKVARLAPEVQLQIAARIRAGEDASEVVASVGKKSHRPKPAYKLLEQLRDVLDCVGPELAERTGEIKLIYPATYRTLKGGRDLLDALISRAEVLAVENRKPLAD